MTVQEWGSVGELVAAVATVATLVYLATQIRYARLAASDASRHARAESVREMQLVSLNNREFRDAWNNADPESAARIKSLSERLGVSVGEAELVWHGGCACTFIHWSQYRSMKTADDQRELEAERRVVSAHARHRGGHHVTVAVLVLQPLTGQRRPSWGRLRRCR